MFALSLRRDEDSLVLLLVALCEFDSFLGELPALDKSAGSKLPTSALKLGISGGVLLDTIGACISVNNER